MAIDSALLANAAQLASIPVPTPTRTPIPTLAYAVVESISTTISSLPRLGDERSERIFRALVDAAAAAPSTPGSVDLPTLSLSGLSALAVAESTDATTSADPGVGFLTSRLADLPSAASILVGVFLILVGLSALGVGARSIYFGRDWGRVYGRNDKPGWLQGGVGGIVFGSLAFGLFSVFLTLVVVSRQTEPSLGGWGVLAIAICCSVPGGIVAGRWAWASRSSLAFGGSIALTVMLVNSFHIASVTTRLVLAAVAFPLALVSVHVASICRFSVPLFAALEGSYLFVLGIDTFVRFGFVDALGLFLKAKGVSQLGGGAEETVVAWDRGGVKGLLAACWLLAIVSGIWQGWWGLGIEGENLWDTYLTRFAPVDRLGTHLPPLTVTDRLRSLFSRLPNRSRKRSPADAVELRRTPWDDDDDEGNERGNANEFDFENPIRFPSLGLERSRTRRDYSDEWDSDVDTLAGVGRSRKSLDEGTVSSASMKPAQYGAVSSSDDEDHEELGRAPTTWSERRFLDDARSSRSFGALSGSTAVSRLELERGNSERSDRREDEKAPTARAERRPTLPAALTRPFGFSGGIERHVGGPSKTLGMNGEPLSPRVATGRVEATPSLLTALERIRTARLQARQTVLEPDTRPDRVEKASDSARSPGVPSVPTQSRSQHPEAARSMSVRSVRRKSMDEFWRAVVEKSETAK